MSEVVHKGGQFIIQEDSQKGKEATYLALFARHKIGIKWVEDNGITTKKSCECPDFIFEVPDRPTIGLEIVNFICENDKNKATMRLERAAKKVVGYFKQKGIPLSLVVDVYDPRENSIYLKDHIDAHNNPGFDRINASVEELKDTFISALESDCYPKLIQIKIMKNYQMYQLKQEEGIDMNCFLFLGCLDVVIVDT